MRSIIIFITFILCSLQLSAQKTAADEKFRQYEYAAAIPLYEKHTSNHTTDYESFSRLATAYRLTNNIPKAIETYNRMLQLPETTADDLYEMVQLNLVMQNEEEARKYANLYKQKMPGEKADNLIRSLDNRGHFLSTANDYTIVNKTANYPFSVLSAYPFSGGLIVTAEKKNDKSNKWTGRSYTDLYITSTDFAALNSFAANIMTDLNDGFPTFTNNGQTMYFTSTNNEGVNVANVNTRKLHLVSSELKNGTWTETSNFAYNSNTYNTAHPTISKDGTLLVFSSDMPGGKGGMDLYYCTKQGNSWSAPQNISTLNTYGNELFPVFQSNGDLTFSSNGLPGLGGLDLFRSIVSSNSFAAPVNMMAPLNSSYDDFCLTFTTDNTSGYLTSNRWGNTQIDNIMHFDKAKKAEVPPPPPVVGEIVLKVTVVDKYTQTPLPYVSVSVKDKGGNLLHKGMTDENGRMEMDVLPKGAYVIQGILNDVTTTIASVAETEFTAGTRVISKEVNHNDPRFTMKGIVVNSKNTKPVEGVTVACKNQTLRTEKTVVTGPDGKFFFQLEQKSDFKVSAQKNKWLSSETADETTKGLDRSKELYVQLTLNLQEPSSDAVIRLNKIYYDYAKCDIKQEAGEELNRLVRLLNDYPDMNIELSSHTDSRGADEYNLKLSQCRADAAVAYIVSKKINKSRIQAKGYGETKLLNKCGNNVTCTEELHQENRRTEFRITSCKSCPQVAD